MGSQPASPSNLSLTRDELRLLVQRVFAPGATDRTLLLLTDLPDAAVPDNADWELRRRLVVAWHGELSAVKDDLGMDRVELVAYRNPRRNNAELPERGWRLPVGAPLPATAEAMDGPGESLEQLFAEQPLIIAATEFSATAPLKLAAKRHGLRAATMPGFSVAMIPALRLDYASIAKRCIALKRRLDPAVAAHLHFAVGAREHRLVLDLRHRTATASTGLVHEPGTAGNLPSGETYIVPYEGELPGDASRSSGELPLQLDGETMVYRIAANRAVEVQGTGPRAAAERIELAREPAYANLAELGLGVLADYGIRAVGELLLDEKLGLHLAFGRSDHFGGSVGPAQFSAPERVVHIDRVYIPEVQPGIHVVTVELESKDGARELLMRDGRYVGI